MGKGSVVTVCSPSIMHLYATKYVLHEIELLLGLCLVANFMQTLLYRKKVVWRWMVRQQSAGLHPESCRWPGLGNKGPLDKASGKVVLSDERISSFNYLFN